MFFAKRSLYTTIICLITLLCMSSCSNNSAEMPDDFNFTIKFGTGANNCIDTYKSTFTKDLILGGTETIEFVIPADKMREMYGAFQEYKISELPEDINTEANIGETATTVSSAGKYSLTYTCNKKTKTIVCNDEGPWDAENGPPESRNRLVSFVDIICEYIYSTEEYKNMSPARGAYQ